MYKIQLKLTLTLFYYIKMLKIRAIFVFFDIFILKTKKFINFKLLVLIEVVEMVDNEYKKFEKKVEKMVGEFLEKEEYDKHFLITVKDMTFAVEKFGVYPIETLEDTVEFLIDSVYPEEIIVKLLNDAPLLIMNDSKLVRNFKKKIVIKINRYDKFGDIDTLELHFDGFSKNEVNKICDEFEVKTEIINKNKCIIYPGEDDYDDEEECE